MSYSNIHNYYEQLVFSEISRNQNISADDAFFEDIACVALNQLPARYVRHDIDMAFYLTSDERSKMHADVEKAVRDAIKFVSTHRDARQA